MSDRCRLRFYAGGKSGDQRTEIREQGSEIREIVFLDLGIEACEGFK
jgi:hypothetical protein